MKTLKSLLLVFGLILTHSFFANNGETSTKELSEKVKHTITTPASLKEKHRSEKITVYFVVNQSGKVVEANALTHDKKAKEELENQFLNLTFEGLTPCVKNSIDINFLVF